MINSRLRSPMRRYSNETTQVSGFRQGKKTGTGSYMLADGGGIDPTDTSTYNYVLEQRRLKRKALENPAILKDYLDTTNAGTYDILNNNGRIDSNYQWSPEQIQNWIERSNEKKGIIPKMEDGGILNRLNPMNKYSNNNKIQPIKSSIPYTNKMELVTQPEGNKDGSVIDADTFGKAFAIARDKKMKVFTWGKNGKSYGTALAVEQKTTPSSNKISNKVSNDKPSYSTSVNDNRDIYSGNQSNRSFVRADSNSQVADPYSKPVSYKDTRDNPDYNTNQYVKTNYVSSPKSEPIKPVSKTNYNQKINGNLSFSEAMGLAKKQGLNSFTWKGKSYLIPKGKTLPSRYQAEEKSNYVSRADTYTKSADEV